MRHSLRILLLVLSVLVPSVAQLSAQTVVPRPAVAFVNSERSSIFVKTPDGKFDSIFHSIPGLISATNIAVLGSDPAGNVFLIGGNFTYLDVGSSTMVNYMGLIAFPKNFNPALGTTQIKFLKRATVVTVSGFRPIGALNADGTEWYASMLSSTTGSIPLYFYHGRMDRNETDAGYLVDSLGPQGEKKLEGGYHLSNISITPDGKMLCSSVDRLTQDNQTRFTFYVWRIHDFPPTMTIIDYSGKVKGFNLRVNPDSNFAFAVYAKSNTRGELALANLSSPPDNSIQFYETAIDGNNVDFTTPSRSIPRSAIPSDMNFFSGQRGTLPSGAQFTEVDPYAAQYGAGGDINFSVTGDTAIFTTHEAPDNISQRFAKSAVYMYDFNTGSATLVYNDPTKLELQPVFITMPFTIVQPEGTLNISTTSLNFGTVDTGKTATKSSVLTNSTAGGKPIVIDSIKIIGQYAANFTWNGATLPATIAAGDAGITLNFTYKASAPAVSQSAVARVWWNGTSTPNPGITLTGTARIPPNTVAREDAHAKITVSPNPFVSTVSVSVIGEEAGKLDVKLFDELGHSVYHTSNMISRGETQSLTINATSLGLAQGNYFLTVMLNDRTTVRQVVLK